MAADLPANFNIIFFIRLISFRVIGSRGEQLEPQNLFPISGRHTEYVEKRPIFQESELEREIVWIASKIRVLGVIFALHLVKHRTVGLKNRCIFRRRA